MEQLTASTLEEGLIPCFPEDLADEQGEPVNAEISAVAYDGKRLIMGSDKPIPGPGRSSVFAFDYDEDGPHPASLEYFTAEAIKSADKYEDFALTVDGRYMIATTGFDRVDDESAELHSYNNLILWPSGRPEAAHVVAAKQVGGEHTSVALRDDLSAALGTPYYKVEGLAAIPGPEGDGQLLFGIRELGANHEEFDYVSQIVGAPYRVRDGELEFLGEFRRAYSFDPSQWAEVRFTVGLSSLEYDPFGERLFLLTSFETEDDDGNERLGGYLWAMTLDDFAAGANPQLVMNDSGGALEFVHKAEGLAVLSESHLFIAYDNDRNVELQQTGDRRANETPYTLLSIR